MSILLSVSDPDLPIDDIQRDEPKELDELLRGLVPLAPQHEKLTSSDNKGKLYYFHTNVLDHLRVHPTS